MIKAIRSQRCAALALAAAGILAGCQSTEEVAADGGAPQEPPDTFAITSTGRLIGFNRATAAISSSTKIYGLAAEERILGFDIRPADGSMVLLTSSARLYKLDPRVGYADLLSDLVADPSDTSAPFAGLVGTSFGVNFNPVPDRLRVVSNTGQNLRINVATGATITDGALSTRSVVAASYTNAFSSACRTKLFYLDGENRRLLTTVDPNRGALVPIGTLDDAGGEINGFEIVTKADGTNSALAVVSRAGATMLMSVNLASGSISSRQLVIGLGSDETITAISALRPEIEPTQALGELVAVTESNRLISFTAAAPQKLCTQPAQITGLQPGDQILGIDVRPADGLLYAAGSSGQLYTIRTTADAGFATATRGAMLQTAPGSVQFASFTGSGFGFDFNPMRDKLRVVSNTGQNLRIDVEAGAVTTDGRLNPTASGSTAAAYTNSFAGAASTTLYVIDVNGGKLAIQGQKSGDPNKGDLKPVGVLGINGQLQSASGFDINGRTSAAFAALNLAGNGSASELYSINLMSGLATRVNAIGGGERVRGLAFAEFPESMRSAQTQLPK
jgi:trimeric autotransporter adhesin